MRFRISRSAALFALIGLASMAHADIVVLKNGDRITGEIQEIWDNDVIIEPAYDDDVKVTISLDDIEYLDSDRKFEVTLKDGREVVAELVGRGPEGKQRIAIDGKITLINLSQLEELDKIEDYFDWESHIDFNFSIDKGNTDALNTRFFTDTKLKLGDHRHIVTLTLSREEQNRITTKDQTLLQYNYNWLFNDPWFFGIAASYERDPIRNLDHRIILGATAGRDLWNKPRLFLNVQAGLGYLSEKDTGNDDNESMAVIWALRYRQDFFASDLELHHDDSINAYVTGRANTVFKTVTGLRYEITDLLYFNTDLIFDYETEPLDGAENEDLSFVVGLGVEF